MFQFENLNRQQPTIILVRHNLHLYCYYVAYIYTQNFHKRDLLSNAIKNDRDTTYNFEKW